MRNSDSNESIAITREIYWVGFFEKVSKLHCNPYLIIDEDEAVLIDPGSIPDFPVIMRKIIELINPNLISSIIVSHQDPDVCGNLAVMEDIIDREDLKIIAHSNTRRLIQHQGLQSELMAVDEMDYKYTLKSGRVLEFLHMPFLHSPGAIAIYDRKTYSLFSGDIFGAINEDWNLFTDSLYPESMRVFHESYMPGNKQLKWAMNKFNNMEIERILPQHGSVIEAGRVQESINYLMELPCGVDLMGE